MLKKLNFSLSFLLLFSYFAKATTDLSGPSLVSNQVVKFSIKDTKNKAFSLVIFLSSTCPCSHKNLPYLKKLKSQYPDLNVIGVHSNQDENIELAKKYFAENVLPFEVIQDDHAVIADRLRANKTPHVFLYSPSGELLYQGGITDSTDPERATKFFLVDAIRDGKAGRAIATKEGKTLGCTIARKK
ncbi:MAG: redoxin domain-containing protein [Bacteriovoracaceae bacterium]|nr:redoxin domain-containing protein [Bacteriovoracaceae bacterium]